MATQDERTTPLKPRVKEIEKKLEIIDRLLGHNADAVVAAETRLRMAKEELPQLIAKKDEARAERGKAVASGNGQASPENLAGLAEQIRTYGEMRELCEDEITGLTASLEQLSKVRAEMEVERRKVAREIPTEKIRDVARRYNALAEQLAPVLREFWTLRAELGEPPQGCAVHSPAGMIGALECVPRVFIPGEEDFIESGDPEKHFFFDAPGVQEKRTRRVRPLTVDEEPQTEGRAS
jgi:hypothetical protein